jgi:hypothetical protein
VPPSKHTTPNYDHEHKTDVFYSRVTYIIKHVVLLFCCAVFSLNYYRVLLFTSFLRWFFLIAKYFTIVFAVFPFCYIYVTL